MKKLFDKEAAKRFWNNIKKLFLRKPQNKGAAGKYLKYVSEDVTEWADFPAFLTYKGTTPTETTLRKIQATKGDVYTVVETKAEWFYDGTDWEYIGDLVGGEFVKKTGDIMTGMLTMKFINDKGVENRINIQGNSINVYHDGNANPAAKIKRDQFTLADSNGNIVFKTKMTGSKSIQIGVNAAENSIALGANSSTNFDSSLAVGVNVKADGEQSFAFGVNNTTGSSQSGVMGSGNTNDGSNSLVGGYQNTSDANSSLVFGQYNTVKWSEYNGAKKVIVGGGNNQIRKLTAADVTYDGTEWAETDPFTGNYVYPGGENSFVCGYSNTVCGQNAFATGTQNRAFGRNSHVEGYNTTTYSADGHAEGDSTIAVGKNTHAEGDSSIAYDEGSHAEGRDTQALGHYSHAEGNGTIAGEKDHSSSGAHAEGWETKAIGNYGSHAEGWNTEATEIASHAEGCETKAIAAYAHAEGYMAEAKAFGSHAQGVGTITCTGFQITDGEGQCVVGKYNSIPTAQMQFIVGGGTNSANRKNLFVVNTDGTATVAHDPMKDMDVATKKYVDTVKDYAISLNGQAAEITKKNTIIDEQHNSIEFYSGYNSTLLENFTAANISQIAKGTTKITGTNWWGFSRTDPVGTPLYYPLIYFDKVSVKLIFNITITKINTNKSATYPVCILADTPPTHTVVILSELPKGLDFTLSKKPDKPSGTTQLLSLKVDSSFLSGCDVKIQLKQYSFIEGDKLGLKMVTNFEIPDNIPSYSNMTTNKNWIDYMEETTQIQAKSHPSIIGTEVPWQSLEEAVAQSAINQIQGATKGNITLKYSPDILLNIDNITFEVGDHIPDTSYLYYTLKNFTNKLALS